MLIAPFRDRGIPGREAIAAVLDLEGFSHFLMQPDVHLHAPAFLNHVFSGVQALFVEGRPSWLPSGIHPDRKDFSLPEPTFAKYLGDGALYIWTAKSDEEIMTSSLRAEIISSLWAYKAFFSAVRAGAVYDVPLAEIPYAVRVGVTRGTVYGRCALGSSEPIDYIGHCINLAARLQGYCKDLGFIASARLGMTQALATERLWKRVVATQLRGMGRELIYVDESEFNALPETVRTTLFAEAA